MKNISSKHLNLSTLSILINNSDTSDCALLITNFGYIIGELDLHNDDDNPTVAKIISTAKCKIIESSTEDLNIVSDGSMISIKNAMVKYSNNTTFNFSEFTLHSDQVVGFAPINREFFLSQLD